VAGKIFRMQELGSLQKARSASFRGKPGLTWLGSVEEDLNNMGMRNWRRNSQDRIQWRTILEEDKVYQEL